MSLQGLSRLALVVFSLMVIVNLHCTKCFIHADDLSLRIVTINTKKLAQKIVRFVADHIILLQSSLLTLS